MADIITHEKDDLLREHVLVDDQLMLAEIGYPGHVRLASSGRYHARLLIGGVGYTFSIKQTGADAYELVSTYPAGQDAKDTLLDELVWHRAAEAMLAHRKGHFEAYHNKLLRKPKRQDA